MKKKTNGKKLNSSVDSESQASTESNAQPDQPKKSTKGGVVPTTKSPRGRPARGAKSSPEREEPPAKKAGTNKRSTRNSIQPGKTNLMTFFIILHQQGLLVLVFSCLVVNKEV